MPELYKRDWDLSMAPCASIPWWNSTGSQTEQSSLSRNVSFKLATPPKPIQHSKQLEFQVNDQDSSSTQSTGQSYPEVACVKEIKNCGKSVMLKELGSSGTHGKLEEGHTKSTPSSQDYTFLQPNVDYEQSFGSVPFTYPDTYCHGIVAAYGSHPVFQSQMLCVTPTTRVPLPLDLPQDEPIYVNAKQYRAILRRRQYRAKLEAQNKLLKNRKPYLHESRHRHALNRVRGPGGRFLNRKKLEESKTSATDGQDNAGSGHSQFFTKVWASEVHQHQKHKEVDSTTSSSDITTATNVDNIFHQQEFDFSVYPSRIGGPMQHGGGGGGGGGIPSGTQHYLSIPP